MNNFADIRQQFPILESRVNGQPLIYFDNAATSQKPLSVIKAESDYYLQHNANIHRGVHTLSRTATDMFEQARRNVASHFNVNSENIIFTAGTTDGINIVAQGLAETLLKDGDEIILSSSEHHSNILPWQQWAVKHNGRLTVLPLREDQSIDLDRLEGMINPRTRVIAITHVSNTLGLITDIDRVLALARLKDIPVLIDGAQSAPHMAVDLKKLQPDFFVCSAHKMYGPTGTGMLYLSDKWLKELNATRGGGGTIKTVTFEKTVYVEGHLRFEPGTPNIAGAIGFSAAIDFMRSVGMDNIYRHEQMLTHLAQEELGAIPEVALYGAASEKAGVVSFNVGRMHHSDVGTLLDKYGIAVRTGHHCTQPLMNCLNISGTVRASFAVYNTAEEVKIFAEKLKKVIKLLS